MGVGLQLSGLGMVITLSHPWYHITVPVHDSEYGIGRLGILQERDHW